MLRTPFVTLVPIRVSTPLTVSDLCEDMTSVEPGSVDARRAAHSSRPDLRD